LGDHAFTAGEDAGVTDEDSTVIANMRARAEQCRRLAKAILDRSASAILLQMAEEVEADIKRLEGGQDPDPPHLIQPPAQH
jgi:hypothetical protein